MKKPMIYLNHDFNPIHTFECGQCFRWNANPDNADEYTGIASGRVCRVKGNTVYCPDCDNEFWENYFCADIDYGAIKSRLEGCGCELKAGIEYGGGIRILRQDIWEMIISFIISANNNISRIKKIIEAMCRNFGVRIEAEEGEYYSFPTAEKLNSLDISDLACLKAGYRDKYIMDAAAKISCGEVCIDKLADMPTADAKKELMKIKGVGGKVADCILLFSLSRYEVFPKDVWIKRVLKELYEISESETDSFVEERFGNLAGYAQQYLYYWARAMGLGAVK